MKVNLKILYALALLFTTKAHTEDVGRQYLNEGKIETCQPGESGFTFSYQNDVFIDAITGFQCAKTKHHLKMSIIKKNEINGIEVKNIQIRFATDINGKRHIKKALHFT